MASMESLAQTDCSRAARESGVIANSGHWIMEEQPTQTVQKVNAFLDRK